jgi:hypothetical protein
VPRFNIDRAARGRPLLQVAAHGRWESADVAPLPLTRESVDEVLYRLGAPEVAVEVLWPGPPAVFVGARVAGGDRPRLGRLAARSDWTPTRALQVLAGGPLGPPVHAELGAINAWRSVGAVPIGLDADAATIASALAGRADLALCHRPVALEILSEEPRQAWWAIEVSSREAGAHRVRVDQVVRLLSRA